jgi:hypothetical protein
LIGAALVLLLPARSVAQEFHLPVDVGQGLVIHSGAPRTPYVFQASLAPSLDLGNFRISAALSPIYLDPKWDFGVGGQVSVLVPLFLHDLGVRLATEGLYLPRTHAGLFSFGVFADVFGLLRLGIMPGFETGEQRVSLRTVIGVDLANVVRVAGGSSSTDLPESPPQPSVPVASSDYDLLRTGVRSRVLGILPQERMAATACWLTSHQPLLDAAQSVATLQTNLAQASQSELADQVQASLTASPPPANADERMVAHALAQGLSDAASEARTALALKCEQP